MVTVPPAFLELLDLKPGSAIGVSIDNGKLVLEPQSRPQYSLEDLLVQCDETAELGHDEWLSDTAVGLELI